MILHYQCVNWVWCHFDHSLLNYNHNFITPRLSWFLNHALVPYFLPSPLVFLSSSLYFFSLPPSISPFCFTIIVIVELQVWGRTSMKLGEERRRNMPCNSNWLGLVKIFFPLSFSHLPLFPPLFYSYFVITYAPYDFFPPIFGPILLYMHTFSFLHLDGIYWIQSKKKKKGKNGTKK